MKSMVLCLTDSNVSPGLAMMCCQKTFLRWVGNRERVGVGEGICVYVFVVQMKSVAVLDCQQSLTKLATMCCPTKTFLRWVDDLGKGGRVWWGGGRRRSMGRRVV